MVTYLIAALESNHNGDLALAIRMVDELVSCGANAVKIPRRHIPSYLTREVQEQVWQEFPEMGKTYGEVLSSLELDGKDLAALRSACQGRIDFIGAPYDLQSLTELELLKPEAYQLDMGLLSHHPLIKRLAELKRPLFIIAGMCTDLEIAQALEQLGETPVTILHGVAAAPLPLDQTALGLLPHLQKRFSRPVGYFSRDEGEEASLAALALGARVLEKPFTLDRHLRGPGHALSAGREDWRNLVRSVRALEASLRPLAERTVLDIETEALALDRVCLVAARDIPAGTALEGDLLAVRASLSGVSPRVMKDLLGKKTRYALVEGTPITFAMVQS